MDIESTYYVYTYQRWKDGRCLCCGSELDILMTTRPKAIAEGVQICGICVERHHDEPIIVTHLLDALLKGKHA